MTRVAILGAGIAGLSSAWLLQELGIDFVVLEKQSFIGGLARSFQWGGFYCDFAAHRLFTSDEVVLQQLLNLVPMGRHVRRSRIFLGGHWMRDPLDAFELGTNLSIRKRLRILWDYLARSRNLPEDNFENYVIRRYGRSLYHLFFQPYTEKLFGIPGDQISVYWARQKVRLANPFDAFRENTKTKFQYFYYPIRGGYGAIVNRLYEDVREHVLLSAKVLGLEKQNGRVTKVTYEHNGQHFDIPIDFSISTLPFSITAKMLGHSFHLNYQKVDAVYLLVDRPLVSDYHWVYFVDKEIAINRMVEFKNMSAVDTPTETSVVCAEVTQHHDDITTKVIDDLVRVGMVKKEEILDTKVVREEYAYPVYDQLYDKTIPEATQAFDHYENLYLVGRAAEFRHREVDDNFASAMDAVQRISQKTSPATPIQKREEPMQVEDHDPRVSAIILTYNHYQDTHECLESVIASDYPSLQVTVVDNGSTDGTPDQVRRNFPQVHVIENNQNLGVPAGYNIGFNHALQSGADYILMLNNDTVVPPEMLPTLITAAKSDPNVGIVMPKVLYHGSAERIWSSGGRYRAFPPAILMTDNRKDFRDSTRMIEYAPSCVLLIHRQAFERAGLFDPGYFFLYDDWDFSERVRTHGLNIWYAPDAHMWHKVSTTTKGSGSKLFWRNFGASIVRFYRRHGRPVWISLPVHIGYVILREFLWKQNWSLWPDFWQGMREGFQKPLGSLPKARPAIDEHT